MEPARQMMDADSLTDAGMDVDEEEEQKAQAPVAGAARKQPAQPREPSGRDLDCYPYTFSPLLLFAQGNYFDKGHSNFNSVAEFFKSVLAPLGIDMLSNVLYERKNMLYEELLEHISSNNMIVTCCIESHFTAFQVVPGPAALYYDPLDAGLTFIPKTSFTKFAAFLLLKCNYGNSQHIQENKNYYTDHNSNDVRRTIYGLWKNINDMSFKRLYIDNRSVSLNLDRYLLINNRRDPTMMSTQETGNTCYFQTYLFALLCKITRPRVSKRSVELEDVQLLDRATVAISRFLLQFFVEGKVRWPLGASVSCLTSLPTITPITRTTQTYALVLD